jgi:uncharacterized membrane-anchored protein
VDGRLADRVQHARRLADSSGLGFAGGALLIGGLLGGVLIATFFTKLSRVALFWAAFVLTRPFGATLGAVLAKAKDKGGLNLGTAGASGVPAMILVVFVVRSVVLQRRRRVARVPRERACAGRTKCNLMIRQHGRG